MSDEQRSTEELEAQVAALNTRLAELEADLEREFQDQPAAREKAFEKLFNGIQEAVFVHELLDRGFGNFLEVNDFACRRYGYTREEFLGLSPADISAPHDVRIKGGPEARRELKDRGQAVFEATHITREGERFPVEINSRVFRHLGKDVEISIVRDLTALKKAEGERRELQEQLWQAQKLEAVGRLAGGVAHDFNNMLAVILGHLELVFQALPDDSPLRGDMESVQTAAERSRDLTRQLLAFARRQVVTPRVMDLNEALEGDISLLRRILGEDIDLVWMPGPDLWPVNMDEGQVVQILTNLCVNARDAIDGPGRIIIETGNTTFAPDDGVGQPGYRVGDFVMLAVTDNGCGMDEDLQAQAFEPFFTTKDKGAGTGLGLAVIYGVVKQAGGFVSLYSEPGQGSTFKVYLPRHQGSIAEDARRAPTGRTGGAGETILLVEDEASIRSFAVRMLGKMGYKVAAVATPGEALAWLENNPDGPDLLITDVVLPEMNGSHLAARMQETAPGLRVLYMSGYTANVIAHRGVVSDGVNFLQKPFTMQDLGAKVAEVLAEPV